MVEIRDPVQLPGVSRATATSLADRLAALYANAEQRLAEHIARQLAAGIDSPAWAQDKLLAVTQLRQWTRTLMARLAGDTADEVRYMLLRGYLAGGTEATRTLAGLQNTLPEWINKAGIDPGEKILGALNGRRSDLEAAISRLTGQIPGLAAIQRMVASLTLRINGTHLPVLRWAEDSYREVIATAGLPGVLLGTLTRRAASQHAWEHLVTHGITGFTDKAGRGWNLASYVEMATRTGVAQAAVEGHMDRLADAGIDLVIVSNSPHECKLCRRWEGKILTRNGPGGARTITAEHAVTDKQVTVEVAGSVADAIAAGLLHPNCRHTLTAYLPGLTKVPTNTEDPEGDAARQKLRGLEREVRALKLAATSTIDPTAKAKLEARVRAKQAQIRRHVSDTEHLGIFRKPEREQPNLGHSAGLIAGRRAPVQPTPAAQAPVALEPPMAVPDRAKPFHVSMEGLEDLARSVEAGKIRDETALTGGVSAVTNLVTLGDGTRVVRKIGNPDPEHAASMIGRALGVDVPRVYRNHPHEVWMDYISDAKTWSELAQTNLGKDAAAYASDDGKRIGLLDLLINNGDRNSGNWMMRPDGGIVAIDHGHAFLVPTGGRVRADIGRRGPFTQHFIGDDGRLRANDFTPADIAEIRTRLQALEPSFAHIGRPRWLEYALVMLDAIEPHASGTRNLVAGVR